MDAFLSGLDQALRTVFVTPPLTRPCPKGRAPAPVEAKGSGIGSAVEPAVGSAEGLSESERALSGALMRVNHVGEVCAQALYAAQAFATKDPVLRAQFRRASEEESDHLAWTRQRMDELGARPSLLNPLWYAGAFGLGVLAGKFGDKVSLGFMAETERQVAAHLQSHLQRLPPQDMASRAIVTRMKEEEAEHARHATEAGGVDLPLPVKALMRRAGQVMTTVAHRI